MNSVYTRIKLLESELESIGDSETNDNNMSSDSELFNKFIKYCKLYLRLETIPKIILTKNSSKINTYGRYDPVKKEIIVYIKDRAIGDVLRSIAHEFIHYKQYLNNELPSGSGKTGSNQENNANSQAGIIMRNFGKLNPVIYESPNNDITKYIDELILEAKLLVPKRIDTRAEKEATITYKRIQKYIDSGMNSDLFIEDSTIKYLPDGLTRVGGFFKIKNCNLLKSLPPKFKYVERSLIIDNCNQFESLPEHLTVGKRLELGNLNSMVSLPIGLVIKGTLDLYEIKNLKDIPNDIEIGNGLKLDRCPSIIFLPDELNKLTSLYIGHCKVLNHLPKQLSVGESINITNCPELTTLSEILNIKTTLSISNTPLKEFPKNMSVGGNMFVRNIKLDYKYDTVEKMREYLHSIGASVGGQLYITRY